MLVRLQEVHDGQAVGTRGPQGGAAGRPPAAWWRLEGPAAHFRGVGGLTPLPSLAAREGRRGRQGTSRPPVGPSRGGGVPARGGRGAPPTDTAFGHFFSRAATAAANAGPARASCAVQVADAAATASAVGPPRLKPGTEVGMHGRSSTTQPGSSTQRSGLVPPPAGEVDSGVAPAASRPPPGRVDG
jgi:hypothetical protein